MITGPGTTNSYQYSTRIGIVQFYFVHNVELTQGIMKYVIAYVNWFKPHPDHMIFGPPIEVWFDSYLPLSDESFIPVANIFHPVAFVKDKVCTRYGNETVVITVPLDYI